MALKSISNNNSGSPSVSSWQQKGEQMVRLFENLERGANVIHIQT